MSTIVIEKIIPIWNDFSKFVHVLHNEQDYEQAVALLDNLIDSVGENENHPLASLMELVGILIEQYEDTYIPEIDKLNGDVTKNVN